jgi:hypothetical protein
MDKKREIYVDECELLIAEVCRVVTREVDLVSVSVFQYARPTVIGLRIFSTETLEIQERDKHGDWKLVEVVLDKRRRRWFMHAYSVVLPTPVIWVDSEIWWKLKETFHENVFKLTTQTLVMRTREFGFHVMTGGKVYRWDTKHKAFRVFNQLTGVFRHYGILARDNRLVFQDLMKDNLRTSQTKNLPKPPHYDLHAKRVLRFALVEGDEFFALYDSVAETGMHTPVFVDDMKYVDEFQMILSFLDVGHGRFTKTQGIVNGRHYPIHMENTTFSLFHDYNYTYIYKMIRGASCKILHSNLGYMAVFGNNIVELNRKILLRQIALYG